MRKHVLAAVAALALASNATVSHAQGFPDPENIWVLVGVDSPGTSGWMTRDIARDADIPTDDFGRSIVGRGVATFHTAKECQSAVRHILRKYAGQSSAGGEGGYYLCSNLRNWMHG
jgi:hypothetical protein